MSNPYVDEKIDLVINKLTKAQYEKAILSGLIDDKQLYLISDDKPEGSDVKSRYDLVQLTPALSNIVIEGTPIDVLTCKVEDLQITTIQLSNNDYPLIVYMPSAPETGARDFCVRVECLSSAPSIAFFGSNNESCDFESTDDTWATLDTGANLFNFTETKRAI